MARPRKTWDDVLDAGVADLSGVAGILKSINRNESRSDSLNERTNARTNDISDAGTNDLSGEGTNARTNDISDEGTNAGTNDISGAGTNAGTNDISGAGTNAGTNDISGAGTNDISGAGTNAISDEGTPGLTKELAEERTQILTGGLPKALTGSLPKVLTGGLPKSSLEPRLIRMLTADCRRVLNFIIANTPLTIGYDELSEITGVGYASLRKYTKKLDTMGFISKHRICEGAFQGTCFVAEDEMCKNFIKFLVEKERTEERKVDRTEERKVDLTKELTEAVAHTFKKEVVENTTTPENKTMDALMALRAISLADFELFWPTLFDHGFGPANLQDVIDSRTKNGMWQNPEHEAMALKIGLTHANAQVEIDPVILDAKGKKANVANWVFRIMVRTGTYPKPAGWEDPALVALREATKQEEERRALEIKAEEARAADELRVGFEEFWANVPEDELNACRDASPVKTDEAIKRVGRIRWTDRKRAKK